MKCMRICFKINFLPHPSDQSTFHNKGCRACPPERLGVFHEPFTASGVSQKYHMQFRESWLDPGAKRHLSDSEWVGFVGFINSSQSSSHTITTTSQDSPPTDTSFTMTTESKYMNHPSGGGCGCTTTTIQSPFPLYHDVLLPIFELYRDDYGTLYRFSLVNKEFNRTASKLLYARVVLSPPPSLLRTLNLRDQGSIVVGPYLSILPNPQMPSPSC